MKKQLLQSMGFEYHEMIDTYRKYDGPHYIEVSLTNDTITIPYFQKLHCDDVIKLMEALKTMPDNEG